MQERRKQRGDRGGRPGDYGSGQGRRE